VQTIQGVSLPNDAAAVGLNMTKNYIGFYDGAKWSMVMKNEVDPGTGQSIGKFFFGAQSGNRIEWNGTILAGYSAASIFPQWYADSRDGQIYAGDGNVVLNRSGIVLFAGNYNPNVPLPTPKEIQWRNPANLAVQGRIGAGYSDITGVSSAGLVLTAHTDSLGNSPSIFFVGRSPTNTVTSYAQLLLANGESSFFAEKVGANVVESYQWVQTTGGWPNSLRLNAGYAGGPEGANATHVYIEFFHPSATGTGSGIPGRTAWMGFGTSKTQQFTIKNEAVAGELILASYTGPAGSASINTAKPVVALSKFAIRSITPGLYAFMEFFPDYSLSTTRRAWLGFGSGDSSFSFANEMADGSLQLLTTGTNGAVYINNILRVAQGADLFGAKIQTSGNIHALGAVTSERFYQLKESTRPVGNLGHWRIYSEGGILYLIDGAGARWRFNITAA
jgi:hypothetical protein